MSNTFAKIENSYGNNPFIGYSFLINKGMFDCNSSIDFWESYVFESYFIPYFRYNYSIPYLGQNYNDLFLDELQLYNNYDIHFYYNTIGTQYQIAYHNNYSGPYLVDISNDYYPPTDFAFIGLSYDSYLISDSYLDDTLYYRNTYCANMPVFYYNIADYDISNYTNNIDFYTSNSPFSSTPHINDMIVDFINGVNIEPYDNWHGVANCTHKMINFSQTGWMQNLGPVDYLKLDYVASTD